MSRFASTDIASTPLASTHLASTPFASTLFAGHPALGRAAGAARLHRHFGARLLRWVAAGKALPRAPQTLALATACGLGLYGAADNALGGALLAALVWLVWCQWQLARGQTRVQRELDHACRARDAALEALAQNHRHVAMASHDLRQPVYTLGLLADAIATRTRDPVLQPTVAQLRRVMASMGTLCDALLDPAHIDRAPQPVPLRTAELHLLMAEVLAGFDDVASRAGLSLRARSGHVGLGTTADPLLLKRALCNLVQNAVRYTPRGGVLLAVRRRGSRLRFEVHDTGVGIAAEDTQRVFAPHQRTAQGQHLHAAGHGLGLAIVARCAHLMGATCGVRSVPGRGSCFWLSLPAARTPGAA
jgi:signal transduction histidine kinase